MIAGRKYYTREEKSKATRFRCERYRPVGKCHVSFVNCGTWPCGGSFTMHGIAAILYHGNVASMERRYSPLTGPWIAGGIHRWPQWRSRPPWILPPSHLILVDSVTQGCIEIGGDLSVGNWFQPDISVNDSLCSHTQMRPTLASYIIQSPW